MKYKNLEALYDAIEEKKLDPTTLSMHLDGGEVMVYGKDGQIYSSDERAVIIEFFELFMSIQHIEH